MYGHEFAAISLQTAIQIVFNYFYPTKHGSFPVPAALMILSASELDQQYPELRIESAVRFRASARNGRP